ncbi:MAG: cell-cycle response regulator DivK [Henriciella sp.]|jgi:two-component system cell cycle response regulator DivK|mmetsp:Transcript_19246/g.24920  ORF Transcript_19246/g.24920 Transcript_19246/m.24920 type:complete len:131 (+) Transcript_19246:68-460(+)
MAETTPRKVLIVEDNALNMRLFSDLLEASGYETLQCVDGAKAVGIALEETPDLIIMDIQLPEVSGLDITRWLKDDERTSEIPVLAVTAFAMRTDEMLVREAGCEGYLSKPIQVRSFLKTVDDLMSNEAPA